ncbi:Yop proteins translocation protein F [Sodalis glossinidius str. 'morsitans']|uniref:Type III secretion apparatus n=2 Tax=Sodalis glossinidius TaxID=63612 RepID=Q2NVJ2_SODGM|nr:type III secretion system needle filament subunit SctF [Sodalis glossinidius]AAS66835.1 YsaG [Sodalis glossinidius]BAE73833.1 type III secretion apparatus [Sodalis glossinidius str. 'morsitans']CRL44280.1 Yop proteins translocation protein F [Sodalis glossinidius str. 'morsitans']
MSDLRAWNGNGWFIDDIAKDFDTGAQTMMEQLETARKALSDAPDNPSVLAEFQAKLSEYTLFRNAQSSTVKTFKDIGAAIIQNFR